MSDHPLTDVALSNCGSMSEAGRKLVNHAQRMESDRWGLIVAMRTIIEANEHSKTNKIARAALKSCGEAHD